MEFSSYRISLYWLLGLCLLLFETDTAAAQNKRGLRVSSARSFGTNVKSTSGSNGISFDCPEEFGYYPHPTDCTQYYVCVFGGALLESCTGGLMYSHELQTCDWPRNVGCEVVDSGTSGTANARAQTSQQQQHQQHVPSRIRFGVAFSSPAQEPATEKAATVPPQYHRSPPQIIQAQVHNVPPPPPPELRVAPNPVVTVRGHPKPLLDSREDIAKLYTEAEETLPPVEEEDSNRQQRVYRGQPSPVSQVQRDRDGIAIQQASINAIPNHGKIGSYAFGTAFRVESSSPSSLVAQTSDNIFLQPSSPAPPPPQLASNRNYYNTSIYNHGVVGYQTLQQAKQQQLQQPHQQQQQPTPFQQQQQAQQQQQQPQDLSNTYDSSYYSVYDDDIDLYRDIEYQQQQQQQQQQHQQQQQQAPQQYQQDIRQQQQQQQTTYRPLELLTTPTTATQRPSYIQPQLSYNVDYDEEPQIEQENVYEQPTRAPPQRPDEVTIQSLDARATAATTAAYDTRHHYDTVVGYEDTDYSYGNKATAAGSYQSERPAAAPVKVTQKQVDADYYANDVTMRSNAFRVASTTPKWKETTVARTTKTTTPYVKLTKPTTTTTTTTTTTSTTTTQSPSRNNNRNRGSTIYTNQDRDVVPTSNRGTHPPRTRPTLKPSGTIVSKAQEFVDIYRYPPTRPDPLYPQPTPDKTAAKCRKDVCQLPDCYCGGKDIPGELPVESIPQIVLLTFDDSVNDLNKQLYIDLFEKGRVNPNGCPISATFYVSHEWTDYSQVQNLYADGHEMASHTVSHSFGEQFSQKKWTREIAGQREILSAYGGVKLADVRGMRAPFLSVGGNKMYKMLYDSNFTYDSSMPVYENRPPSWPYTLDYKIFHDCMIPPCPTRSYPGVWQVPMVMWQDLNGGRCSMGDACSNPSDADGVTKMIMKNFERHYTTNRAPFGLFYHAAWFTQPHHKEGFIKFLDAINAMQDVWIITNWQALQWVRDPTPTSRINSFQPFQCDYSDRPKRCNNPKVCNLWHKSGVRYMKTCQPCPDIYPWTGKSGIRSSRIDNDNVEETAA
ncbi:uncharacterized protein LOC108607618 isoform X1 [Drosophila busckii]|uniref:uncharacterized protein LOC108607618 isoform X1 n=1 Tax=Drosophila busckii TaxID=30019 RepID=UPI00083F4C33|nr:uncharacterized protein LOC108607618 isoform X1 [Drosophila busckii]XP_033150805.1 uncharacterized protein LOC108607618 isoform X1 [Drosophila busckii]